MRATRWPRSSTSNSRGSRRSHAPTSRRTSNWCNGAIFEINAALAEDPDNEMLQSQLLSAYREQLSLLRRVGGLTRNVMMRNDI